MAFSMAACSENEIEGVIVPDGPDPVVGQETEVSRAATDIELSVPGDVDWAVVSEPGWVGIRNRQGIAGEKISVYVECNIFDDDRVDTITVSTEGGQLHKFPLRQLGNFRDPDNGVLTDDFVSSYGVGFGVNVLTHESAMKYDLKNAVVNQVKLAQFLESIGESEAFWEDQNYISSTDSYVGTTTSAISNQLSVEAGIGAEISGFEMKLKGAFSTSTSSEMHTSYAMRSIKHTIRSRYLRGGALRYLTEKTNGEALAFGLRDRIARIKDGIDPEGNMDYIIRNYGTHMITYGALGGSLDLAVTKESSKVLSEQEIRAALEVTLKGTVGVSGDVTLSSSESSAIENTTVSVVTYGGKNPEPVSVGTAVKDILNKYLSEKALTEWVSTLRTDDPKKLALALIDIKVVAIWDLIPDKEVAQKLHEYVVNKYQTQLLKHEPLIYVVDGLDYDNPDVDQGFVDLPEINVRLEYFDGIVPEIDRTKTVRVLYSGTMDKMNYDRGFCVGGDGVVPGKLRRDRFGNYTYEPFQGLNTSRITSVYVDATGDVTIAPQSTINYINRTFRAGGLKLFNNLPEDINIIDKLMCPNPRLIPDDKDSERTLYEEARTFWDENAEWPRGFCLNGVSTVENGVTRTGFFPEAIKKYAADNDLKIRLSGGTLCYFYIVGVEFCFYTKDGKFLSSKRIDLDQVEVNSVDDLYIPLLFDVELDYPAEADCIVLRFLNPNPTYVMQPILQNSTYWHPDHLLKISFSPEYLPNPL